MAIAGSHVYTGYLHVCPLLSKAFGNPSLPPIVMYSNVYICNNRAIIRNKTVLENIPLHIGLEITSTNTIFVSKRVANCYFTTWSMNALKDMHWEHTFREHLHNWGQIITKTVIHYQDHSSAIRQAILPQHGGSCTFKWMCMDTAALLPRTFG